MFVLGGYPSLARWPARRRMPRAVTGLAGLGGLTGLTALAAAGSLAAGVLTASGAAATAGTGRLGVRTVLVTSLREAGPGTLRAALTAAADSVPSQPTHIHFTVRGTITLASALPTVIRPVTIDGMSAPGYHRGGPPVLEIDCHGHPGLRFATGSAGSRLLGLAVARASGNGVSLLAGRVTLNGDYIGLNLAGHAAGNRGNGVYAGPASTRNQIGRNPARVSGAVANVISGNGGSGIMLAGSSRNRIVANRIGTGRAGRAAIGNRGDGITITGRATGNEIGGRAFVNSATGQANNPTGSKGAVPPVFVVPPLGNQISGNGGNGVLIDEGSRRNVLNGNFIGTTATGDAALGNAGNGVWIDRARGNSLTGCKFVNNPFVYYNVVSGNGRNGLRITDSRAVVVQGNFFGTGANNTAVVANRRDGIRVDGDSAGVQVGGVIPLGNVSAGNGHNGIEVAATARGFTTFNTFGGLLAFKGAAPNGRDGLLITSSGRGDLVRTNVFSGNRRNGIQLAGHATGVTVDPDIVGLTTKGNALLPNGHDGVLIDGGAHGNTIGGTLRSVIPQNTFSGNRGYGLVISGRAHDNRVRRSFIGTAVLGVSSLGNRRGGVLVAGSAYRNVIGLIRGHRPANLVSGNTGNGVTLLRRTRHNLVTRNFIGLSRLRQPLPNTGHPVLNLGRHNRIVSNRT